MTKDLEFLDSYWKELKRISIDIQNNLPKRSNNNNIVKIGKKLNLISYLNLDDWSVDSLLKSSYRNLIPLAEKIKHMIKTGKSDSIRPMLYAICYSGIRKQSNPSNDSDKKFLGFGHFRWNSSAIMLTTEEINKIKEYFNI
jgi:hypothetical protein